jgi:hypothetical protein
MFFNGFCTGYRIISKSSGREFDVRPSVAMPRQLTRSRDAARQRLQYEQTIVVPCILHPKQVLPITLN